MLVLTRKLGEEVVIGDNTRLSVLSIRGNKVKLGFTAPPETRIWRMELRARLDEAGGQGPQAADSPADSAMLGGTVRRAPSALGLAPGGG